MEEPEREVPDRPEVVAPEVAQDVTEEVGELPDGRTVRFFSWAGGPGEGP